MTSKVIIKIGEVRYVEDRTSSTMSEAPKDQPCQGLRIKAKLAEDDTNDIERIPWAFPLLPKTFQSVPKVGEAVFILTEMAGNNRTQRYYIGPIISQPQFMTECPAINATSTISSPASTPLATIATDASTIGAFPEPNDVAVVGRGQEDIILKYDKYDRSSEIDIRAGIREDCWKNKNIRGNIIYNSVDPAYIQLKRQTGMIMGAASSVVNIVADRINLISNKDDDVSSLIHDKNSLIPSENQSSVASLLHPLVKGDLLADLLDKIVKAINNHVHAWPGLATCGDNGGYVTDMNKFVIEDILSKHVSTS